MSLSAFLSSVASHGLGETLFPLAEIAGQGRNQLIHGGAVLRTMDEATIPLSVNQDSATLVSQGERQRSCSHLR